MKQKTIRHLLMSLAFLGTGTLALAQTPVTSAPAATSAPFMDPHPYQSQITFRSTAKGINNNALELIPAVIAKTYKYTDALTGNAVTAQNTALLYDKRTSVPTPVSVGGNYNLYGDGEMTMISADGSFTYIGNTTFKKASTVGGVYFVDAATNNLVLVDSYGYYFNTFTQAPVIAKAGGNYFIDSDGVLTTMKSMGIAPGNAVGMATVKTGSSFTNVRALGGNFFLNVDNTNTPTIVTVSSITGNYKIYTPDSAPKFLGGNYYVGIDNLLYTIDSDGNLAKNSEFSVSNYPVLKGYSFMTLDEAGSFIYVDGVGIPHTSILEVSTTGGTVTPLSKLKSIDPATVYLPKN